MGCPSSRDLINAYKPKVVGCQITLCEALAGMIADIWAATWTYPGFFKCLMSKFVFGKTIKPSDLGLPKLKGRSVARDLERAGFDIYKLGLDPALDANTEDNFRHIVGAMCITGEVPLGDKITKALQDSSNTSQYNEAKAKLDQLLAEIGTGTPTAQQQARIDSLRDRMAECLAENAANHYGRKLGRALPRTIFNDRKTIYDIVISTLCKRCCKDNRRDKSRSSREEEGKAARAAQKIDAPQSQQTIDRCVEPVLETDGLHDELDAKRIERGSSLPQELQVRHGVPYSAGPWAEMLDINDANEDQEIEELRNQLRALME